MSSSSSVPHDGHSYIQAHSNFLQNTLYRVMDAALANAFGYFHSEQLSVDASLLPNLVRFWAKHYFQEVKDVHKVADIPNNGLCLHLPDSILRIWKSADGKIANPSVTKQKSEFLTQPTITQPELPFGNMPQLFQIPWFLGSPLRLAVLWGLNATFETELLLGCPKAIIKDSDDVEFHWKLLIPRNASSRLSKNSELKSYRTNDLDLELKLEDTGTEDDDD